MANGIAFRATYVPPPWLIKMVVSLSIGVGMSPTLGVRFNLSAAAVIHFDSDIFWFARHGKIDGIKGLFRKGRAAPTDRDFDGFTALHVRTVPICPHCSTVC